MHDFLIKKTMVPHKHSVYIKQMLQHRAELVIIEGAGHGVLEEAKHEVLCSLLFTENK